jgi:hypothetical protein
MARVGVSVAAAEETSVGAEVGKAVGLVEQAGKLARMNKTAIPDINLKRGIIDFPPVMTMPLL